jgi:O-antigen ligase
VTDYESVSSKAIAAVALFSLVLVRMPVLIGEGTFSRALVLAPFLLCIAWAGPRCTRGLVSSGPALLVFLYVGIVAVAMLRGAHAGVYSTTTGALRDVVTLAVVTVFGLTLFASATSHAERWRRLMCLVFAPATYVTVNVLLSVAGNRLPFSLPHETSVAAGANAELLGLLGFHTTRAQFPMAQGVNNFGAIAASGLAAAIILLMRRGGPRRLFSAASAVVCLYGALASDSRAALLLTLAVVLLFAIAPRIRTAAGLSILLPLSPVLLIATLSFISSSGLVTLFSRTGDDLLTGSGRLQIWKAAFDVLKRPSLEQTFGYGASGQVTSGAYSHYAYLFGPTRTGSTFTVHNLALQTVLDTGYVGLIVLVGAVVVAGVRLERLGRLSPHSPVPAALAILLVLLFSGTTEALPTYNFLDTLVLAILVLAAGAVMHGKVATSPKDHVEMGRRGQAAARIG